MDDRAPSMLKPTLIGGLTAGAVAGLPLLNMINCACCALIIGGGFLASWLYSRECATRGATFTPGNGALVGLVAGLFYAVGASIVGGLVQMMMPADIEQISQMLDQFDMPDESRDQAMRFAEMAGTGVGVIFFFFLNLLLAAVFSTIGGLIGGAVFRHEPPAPVPPPPPAASGDLPQPPAPPSDPTPPGGSSS